MVKHHMPKENEAKQDRVNVGILRDTHETLTTIAKALGRNNQDCANEAIADWNRKNAPAARKKVGQLLAA